jgi:hypothetical protein
MAPGILDHPGIATVGSRPSKRIKTSVATEIENDDDDVAAAITAVPSHPLGIKPAGNAYTASENIKARCGLFASLPDELLSHILESFEADVLVRLGSTCRALYAFTRLDELWRALFVRLVPPSIYNISHSSSFLVSSHCLDFQSSPSHIFSQVVYTKEALPCKLLARYDCTCAPDRPSGVEVQNTKQVRDHPVGVSYSAVK